MKIFNNDSRIERLNNKIKELESVNKYYREYSERLEKDILKNNEYCANKQKKLDWLIEDYTKRIEDVKNIKEEYRNAIMTTLKKQREFLKKKKKNTK